MNSVLIAEAVAAAGIAILVLDERNQIIACNGPAGQLLRSDPEHLIGSPANDFLPIAASKSSGDDLGPLMQLDSTQVVTPRDKARRTSAIAVTTVQWSDAEGRIRKTLTLRDETCTGEGRPSVRVADRDLVQSNNAIRGANIGVFDYDPAARTVNVSTIWRQILELGPDEVVDVQAEWRSRVHPDDLAAALAPVDICLEGRAERANCEYRLRSRDRTHWRWMRTDIAVAERDPTGKITKLVGAQTDITDHKTMEEELRISVEQFRSAFENAPIGNALVEPDGTCRRVNPALCSLLGYAAADLIGRGLQTVTHPDDQNSDLSHIERLIRGDIQSYSIEKRYQRANGAFMRGKLNAGVVRNAEGRPDHFIWQIVDVTEQKQLDQMKSEFVSIVSHELRTPLTSILGALTLLSSYDDDAFSDEVQRLLFIAKTNGDRLNHLINDILDFQKFSAREMRFSLAPHRMAGLIEETLMANLALADKHNVRFATGVLNRSLIALVDPKRFHQVMANLLSNAVKFANPGSAIEISAERQGSIIRVSVKNTGSGVPESFRQRIFQPFSQASSKSSLRSGGTGLGLSITKQIVEQMGGEIGFESVTDEFTTFWFTILTGDGQ